MFHELLGATETLSFKSAFMDDAIIISDLYDGEQVVVHVDEFGPLMDAMEAILRKRNQGRINEPTENVDGIC